MYTLFKKMKFCLNFWICLNFLDLFEHEFDYTYSNTSSLFRSGSRSDTSSSRDTLFYCYCLAPSSRQPLAMFRWWNNGGWHRSNFDMLIKQANGTLALGVVVVR